MRYNSNQILQVVKDNIPNDLSNVEICQLVDDVCDGLFELKKSYQKGTYQEKMDLIEKTIPEYLSSLKSLSTGYKAELKRSLGVDEQNFVSLNRILSKYSPVVCNSKNRYIWVLCAKIYCFMGCEESSVSFSESLGSIIKSESGIRKFEDLLNTSLSDNTDIFEMYLIRFIRQLKSKGSTFDFESFMLDLFKWDNVSKSVQRTWAENFYKD